ncbi:platelet-derived growth factor receptor beta-like [Eucyclogobius newberryi]|uniref:platelet-derived growth factor receptor beta-like n=1 Tax=Eucyclogobius newberryi TaxID=166745 RepID=UPI003B5C6BC3
MATACTGSLLIHFLLGLFLFSPEGGILSLELLPSSSRVTLQHNSSYSVICSGWSDVTWALPGDAVVGVSVEDLGSSSVLRLSSTTWRQSGRYTCSEPDSDQSRALDLFVPGTGPSAWFLPSAEVMVLRSGDTARVPCSVSDPDLQMDLWERSGRQRVPVTPLHLHPALGFTAKLNDSSYVCSARRGHEEALSQVFYVFSSAGPEELHVELQSSAQVLRAGDPLMLNCTVSESESVYFSWEFPRKLRPHGQELEPLTEFMLDQVRSIINISETSLQDSGVYVCSVEESVHKQKVQKSLNISVLGRGFVDLSPSESSLVQTLLHHTVALSLHIQAFPPPNVTWSIPMATSSSIITMVTWDPNVTMATPSASARNTRLSHTSFLSVLKLEEVQMNQTGSYIATVSNDDDIKEVEFRLEVRAPPSVQLLSEVGVASVLCVSEGAPPPKLTWFICPLKLRCTDIGWRNVSESVGASVKENSTEKQGLTQVHSVLTLKSLDSVSSVRCESKNSLGRRAWDLRLVSSSLLSQVKVLTAVLVLVVLALIFLILLIVLWRKKPRWTLGHHLLDPDALDALEGQVLLDLQWEVSRENVKLGTIVTSGTFGTIVEASVQSLDSSFRATVLMPKSGALQSLLSDLKILVHVGSHLNLLKLLGACTRDRGAVMLISEWCRHGDLSSYLKKHRHTFGSGPTHTYTESDGYMDMTSEDSHYVAMTTLCVSQQPEYELLHNSTISEPQGTLSPEDLSLSDLLSFCFQTACAMDFLSQRHVVHRDLGARNVLVSDGKVLKICDFGCGRDVGRSFGCGRDEGRSSEYVRRGNSFLPVKWMSPENFLCVYTTQSDVWSYGVLLWEIYSMGELPFPDVPVSKFCSELKNGKRLDKPELAPKEIFQLMIGCWQQSPDSRPLFSSLVESLGKLLPPQFHQRYSALTEQFLSDPVVVRTQGRTEPGPDQNPAAVQVTVHLSGAEPETTDSAPSDDIITLSDVAVETRADAALDADDMSDPSEEQEVTSSVQEERVL